MPDQEELEKQIKEKASLQKVSSLEQRVAKLERFCEYECFSNKVDKIFKEKLKVDDFSNKVKSIMNDHFNDNFIINKCKHYARQTIKEYKGKGWEKWHTVVISAFINIIIFVVGGVILYLITGQN